MRNNKTQQTVNQRINFLIDYYEAGNKSAFGRRVDMKSGVVGDLVGGRMNKPSYEALLKILAAYPSVNTDWLVKGEGEMLVDAASTEKAQKVSAHIAPDTRPSDSEVLSPPNTTNARRIPFEELSIRVLPYLPLSARATFAEHYADDSRPYKWEAKESLAVLNVPDTKEYAEALVADIDGDSMEPTIINGSKVVITPVQKGNWQYMSSGIYCVIYSDNFVVKRVKNNTLLETGLLMLHSDNPNGGSFPVKGEDIRAIWRVRWAAYVPLY